MDPKIKKYLEERCGYSKIEEIFGHFLVFVDLGSKGANQSATIKGGDHHYILEKAVTYAFSQNVSDFSLKLFAVCNNMEINIPEEEWFSKEE